MDRKEWQNFGSIFKSLFNLEFDPVAVACLKGKTPEGQEKKLRICQSILAAGQGETIAIGKSNNLCFGAAWHLGFREAKNSKFEAMVKKFVIESEKLFCSSAALDNLFSQIAPVPDNSDKYFLFSPLEKSDLQPQLVIFIVDAQAACRLMTLITFSDGNMPKIKIGGPTCRMSVVYPLFQEEVNLSFLDYTARQLCRIDKDKLLISVPFNKIPIIIKNIDRCPAGRVEVENPAVFL